MARRPAGSIPSYRLYNRTGQAVITLDGRDHYLGEHGSPESYEKRDKLVAEWLARGRAAQPSVSEAGLTVSELVLAYKRHCDAYYADAPAEREKIRQSLRPLRRLYGTTPAADFRPLALQAVRTDMLGVQKRVFQQKAYEGEGEAVAARTVEYRLSRRTINQRIGIVKRMFKWAVSQELVPSAVHEGLRAVEGLKKGRSAATEPRKVQPVADAAVDRTLPFLNPHVRAMVAFQRWTGARSGEVCVLRPLDIDMSGPVWVYRPLSHKNGHRGIDRLVYVGPQAQEALRPLLVSAKPDEFVFSPRRMTEERHRLQRLARKSKVQPSQASRAKDQPRRKPGERYGTRAYHHAVRAACMKAGVAHWHPHQLRHSAGTRIRERFGIEAARIVLGHRHLAVTEIYAEPNRLAATEAMGTIG